MVVLAFNEDVLLVCVGTGKTMTNAKRAKKCVTYFLVFPSPIRLNTLDFGV
jgi:hypothetical protein